MIDSVGEMVAILAKKLANPSARPFKTWEGVDWIPQSYLYLESQAVKTGFDSVWSEKLDEFRVRHVSSGGVMGGEYFGVRL